MQGSIKKASLVTGTIFEVLSAAIIYAGIDAINLGNDDTGISLVIIGVVMFLAGFTILQLRGKLKKTEKETEEMSLLDKFEAFIDWLPNDVKEEAKKKVYELLGYEVELEELPEGEPTSTDTNISFDD